jgi:hypothetical protein
MVDMRRRIDRGEFEQEVKDNIEVCIRILYVPRCLRANRCLGDV